MALIDNCKAMPDDVRARLESISKEFDPTACTCLHGDFHPGNLISGEGGEYWIDLGGFSYGDPLLDISTLYMTAHYTPAGALKSIFHIGRRPFCKFVDGVIRCYYGEALDDKLMQKIKDAAIFKAGISICSTPGSAFIFVPLIRGQKLRFALIMLLVRLLWPVLSRGKV